MHLAAFYEWNEFIQPKFTASLERGIHRNTTAEVEKLDRRDKRAYTHIMESQRPDPDFIACRSCACATLRRASRVLTQHYERSFRGSGLRATQFTLLAVLTQTGPLPLSALAAQAGLERTTLTRNLQPLQAKGLVCVLPTDGDQRVRRVELTRSGLVAARKALPAWRKAQVGINRILQPYQIGNLSSQGGN
jgi:DNA-binding MarR family transcriptional regulator